MGMFNTQRMQLNQPAPMASPMGPAPNPGPARLPSNPRIGGNPRYGLSGTSIRAPGAGGTSYRSEFNTMMNTPDQGGVVAGGQIGPNAVQQAYQQGPSLEQIQAEMARRNVGVQLNQNPANSAMAGYMMG